ncbi:hypothetical protein [Desertivibrio insolitus]|uniref:hypothetical protein n=1 Tax=Herbiconiux sp. SYSU D00978 TaxID=2812562 RepID=UPI001A96BF82|nr:hypothetical protein [Herbiconiux sp. SYSU D00978]
MTSDDDNQPHGENPSVGEASGEGIDKPSQAEGEDFDQDSADETTTDGKGPGDKPSQAEG